MTKQVKSKERVADHGEVFTAEREVNAMLDLVKQETERVDSRFLEPACGDGNFVVEILRRKLEAAKKRATPPKMKKPIPLEYEKQSVIAVSSIYGIDILEDNVEICRGRLYEIWEKEYKKICGAEMSEDCCEAVKYILSKNIICGNALSLMCVDSEQQDTSSPIIFSEWTSVTGDKIKRRDFRLDVLLRENDDEENYEMNFSLFEDSANMNLWEFDPVTNEVIPKPVKEFPLTDYRRVQENG